MAQKANLSFKNKFPYICVIDEASVPECSWGLPRPIKKSHAEESGGAQIEYQRVTDGQCSRAVKIEQELWEL